MYLWCQSLEQTLKQNVQSIKLLLLIISRTDLVSAVAGVEVAAPALRRAVRGVLAQELALRHGVDLRREAGGGNCGVVKVISSFSIN